MTELNSNNVIREAMSGNAAAFRIVVEQHQGFAYSLAFRMVRDEDDAEDIVQEAFVRLWKHLQTYRQEVKLTTWLYKIVANLCLDFLKSKRGKERKNRDDLTKGKAVTDKNTPEDEYERNELMDVILEATEELTPKQKAVFILRDLEGRSVDEVTEILSMPAGNVKSNLFHARQKIAGKLKVYYQTTDKSFIS